MNSRSLYGSVAVVGALATVSMPILGFLTPVPGPGRSAAVFAVMAPMMGFAVWLWSRRPDHMVARRLLLLAFLVAVSGTVTGRPAMLGWSWAFAGSVVVTEALTRASEAVAALVVLVLPDGTYATRWHRVAARGLVGVTVVAVGLGAVTPAQLDVPVFIAEWSGPDHPNPFQVPVLAGLSGLARALRAVVEHAFLAALALLALRYRRAPAPLRLQLRVLLWAVAATGTVSVAAAMIVEATAPSPVARNAVSGVAAALSIGLLFGGIAVSVLRYRLLEVQVLLRRSVLFGALWLLTGAVYVAVAAGLGIAVGSRLSVSVAVVITVAVTLAFEPLRRRANELAQRRLFGHRPSRYELLAQFGQALEGAFDIGQLAPEVSRAVRTGADVEWVRVRLNAGDTAHPVMQTVATEGAAGVTDPALTVPLVHGEELVGVIECGPKREGRFTRTDEELLATLGRQAALAVRNARLAAELSARLDEIERQADEIRRSRARLVVAQDSERRRIERDIHDGVQQGLASLLAKLGLARNQLARGSPLADATLVELQAEARLALQDLRELARGIHPSILSDRGLLEAIEARVAHLPVGVRIDANERLRGVRFTPDVEAAAYFFVAEALTNALKHADARTVTVRLVRDDATLRVAVEDDGKGFVPADADGTGLTGLRDRIEAVGGQLRIRSVPDAGTRLVARFPVPSRRTVEGV